MGEPVPRPTRVHGGAAAPKPERRLSRWGWRAHAYPSMVCGLLPLFFAGGALDPEVCGKLREEDRLPPPEGDTYVLRGAGLPETVQGVDMVCTSCRLCVLAAGGCRSNPRVAR